MRLDIGGGFREEGEEGGSPGEKVENLFNLFKLGRDQMKMVIWILEMAMVSGTVQWYPGESRFSTIFVILSPDLNLDTGSRSRSWSPWSPSPTPATGSSPSTRTFAGAAALTGGKLDKQLRCQHLQGKTSIQRAMDQFDNKLKGYSELTFDGWTGTSGFK